VIADMQVSRGERHASPGKPTLLIVGPTPPPAQGVSVFTETLLASSLREVFRLLHLDTSDRRPSLTNLGRLDLRNVALALYHGWKFQWILLRHHPALIYLPISETNLGFLRDCLFLIPARLFRYRIVVQMHGGHLDTLYANTNPLLKWLMRFCLKRVDRAVILGEVFRGKLSGLVLPEKVRVVPIGISSEIFEVARCNIRTPRNGKRTVLYLGSLLESKGLMDLLRAVPLVLQKRKDVQFLFVGDKSFPDARVAQQWAQEHGVARYVEFVGTKLGPEKVEALLGADTFAFPTWYPLEGQPIVLLEAMSAGLPILTTRHATIPEMLGEEGAVYVNKHDPEDIAAKLCLLLGNDELRARMGHGNQERFLEFHTVERFAQNMRHVFEEALASS
jgi:glycosyltransferase involved in cell wall biosynthesis